MSVVHGVSDWLRRASTGWVALSALVVFFLFAALVVCQASIEG